MDVVRLTYLTIMLIGVGIFSGFVFPCLDGPFNILKILREKIGKPFSCPVCSVLWSVVLAGLFIYWIPMTAYMIFGSIGWGLLLMHVSGYQPFYPGMEDE